MGKNSRTGCVYSVRFGASCDGGRLLSTLTPDDRHKISTNHSRGPRGIPRNARRRKSGHNFVLLLQQTSPSSRKRTTMESTVALYKQLKTEWTKSPINLKLCGTILDKLKVALAGMSYIPTGNAQANQQELLIARDILEIGVEYSIATKNIPAFERYILQLKWFYYDYNTLIGESKNKYQLLGLNLLFLLSQNRVAEFHTELELLPADIIQTNAFIRHPLALEQYLMEGRYNKIFQAKGNVPAESYNFFIDILLQTVRNEIGACLESSYERISLQEAAKRLNLKSKEEVKQFGEKKAWKLSPDGFYHFVNELAKPKEPIPSQELAEQAIMYARELEMIV